MGSSCTKLVDRKRTKPTCITCLNIVHFPLQRALVELLLPGVATLLVLLHSVESCLLRLHAHTLLNTSCIALLGIVACLLRLHGTEPSSGSLTVATHAPTVAHAGLLRLLLL